MPPLNVTSLLLWHPRVRRPVDARQLSLGFEPDGTGTVANSHSQRAGCGDSAKALHVSHGQVVRILD
jgi:hypothetical protein